jgi:benzoyl-CoA 2,3-dioxygenase component A
MEAGVLDVLRDTAIAHGMEWQTLHSELKRQGRLHLETY